MSKQWVIVANSSQSHFYSLDEAQFDNQQITLEKIASFEHPESRHKDTDLTSDRPGSFRTPVTSYASYSQETDPKDHEADLFAKQIADQLEQARLQNKFERLILITPPQFHGLLNKHLHKNIHPMIVMHIDKDYTKDSLHELSKRMQKHLLNGS